MLRKAKISNMIVVYLACVATATAFTPISIALRYASVRAVACSAACGQGWPRAITISSCRERVDTRPTTNKQLAGAGS